MIEFHGLHPSGDQWQEREQSFGGFKQRLLGFLQIFVVGKRQALHRDQQRGRVPMSGPALPRVSSSRSGFFFCGMALLPVE